MSAIRERTGLCLVELPKRLTSRRNLLAHFSKFAEVKHVDVNKELRTGLVNFSTHFDAQTAKTQASVYEGKPLKVFWSESVLDPRSRNKQEYSVPESEPLWQDDEKECFGVESIQPSTRIEQKQACSVLIKKHLKLADIKKKMSENTKPSVSIKSSNKFGKTSTKLINRELKFGKKHLLTLNKKVNPVQKEILTGPSSLSVEQNSNLASIASYEQTDLKHRLMLLNERDKSIRNKTISDSDIKTAVAIKGTCKDMCPERERLSRQCGHSIALYELIPGTNSMDENKAIKEYTRSSADQEVPLPHDLRPEPVLSMTMNYLLTNIISRVDNPEENKAIWYSFCWNRLRSIRKDIILQQLCDMETVNIVEQCARFHISCYDHMYGADISGFDDKINTQNLIDCLQTLRHMYEDLGQHNISCPNEAEFYSYLILLKLKTGDIMWEYLQYPHEIQLSRQVQFAIEAYIAYVNNMYAKYFNLVKKASYLTACLMQRYFDQVRTQAIKIMDKAYCLPGKAVGLSSSYVVSTLKFDSHQNAKIFCENEGVSLRFDGIKDETDDYITTSSFLIREKRLPIANVVVGENNKIPVYIPHQVHSSFDEFGNLKSLLSNFENDNDQESTSNQSEEMSIIKEETLEFVSSENVEHKPDSFKFSLSPTKIQEPFFGKSFSFDSAPQNNPVIDVDLHDNSLTNEEMFQMDHYSNEAAPMDNTFNYSSINIVKSETNVPEFLPTTSIKSDMDNAFSFSLCSPSNNSNSEIFKCEDSIFTNIPTSNFTNHDNLFSFNVPRTQSADNFQETFLHTNIEYNSNVMIGNMEFSYNTTVEEPDIWSKHEFPSQHSEFENRQETVNLKKLDDLIDFEKNKTFEYEMAMRKAEEEKERIEEKRRMEIQRIQMQRRIEEQKTLDNLRKDVGKRLKAINARKCARQWKKRVDHLNKTRADFPMLVQLSVKKHLKLWGTIDSIPVNSVFQRVRAQRNSTNVISHLLLSGITESCKYIGSSIAEELAKSAAKKMKKGVINPVYWKIAVSVPGSDNPTSELSVFNQLMRKWWVQAFYSNLDASLGSVESVFTSLQIPVNMSLSFTDAVQSTHRLESLDALVFIVLNKSESDKECLNRLRSLVSCQCRHSEFSVAVMNIGICNLERVLKMGLEELHDQNLIQNWTVNTWSTPNSIIESLKFLTKHVNVASHICTTPLKLLVENVTEELFDALCSGQHWCNGLQEAVRNPNNVISLYNTCLTKLEDLLMSSKLENYFGLAEEFKMYVPLDESGGPELMCGKQYNDLYKVQISKKVKSLKLPVFSQWPPTSVNDLAKVLKDYCSDIHDACIFPQIIRIIDLPDDVDVRNHVDHVCWLNIVEIWAQCNIRHSFSLNNKSNQMLVMYNENDVHRIFKTQWWIKIPMVTQFNN